jgi:large subunit ribosomal protein L10
MAMSRKEKVALGEVAAGRFAKAKAAAIAEYRGLTVAELTQLRVSLRKADAEFRITKNRVAKKAIETHKPTTAAVSEGLKGPVGIVYMYGDAAAATKALLEFEKDRSENFKVTIGAMEGRKMTLADLKALSSLPSKDVLLSQIVGSLVSPHRGLLGVLKGVPRQLVQVINAIKEKKA